MLVFQIQPGDGLPYLICFECAEEIHKAYSFKQQCERNDQVLKNVLLNTENPTIEFSFEESDIHCDNDSDVKSNISATKEAESKDNGNLHKKLKKGTMSRKKKEVESGVYLYFCECKLHI